MNRIPFEQYAAIKAVNWSSLKHLRDSPKAYRWHRDNPDTGDTTGRMKGRALHTLVFEPHLFDAEYAVFDGDARRGKAWDEFKAANEGKCILKAGEVEEVKAQAAAVRSHPAVQPYLDGGVFESTIQWKDPQTGIPCKARPDWWHPASRTLIDLKGTSTLHPHHFARIAARLGYHCQLAHYQKGLSVVYPGGPVSVHLLAVELRQPYDVALFSIPEDFLYAGESEVTELLRKLRECAERKEWPGRFPEAVTLDAPAYIFGDDENPADLGVSFEGGQ